MVAEDVFAATSKGADDARDLWLRSLDSRLRAVEVGHVEASPQSGRALFAWWMDKVASWLPAITPILVFFLGLWLVNTATQAIENQKVALQQREVELGGVADMRDHVAALYREGLTPSEAEAAALALAPFGGLAATPLLFAINTGSPNLQTGAEVGLAAAAQTSPTEVCAALGTVVSNRSALYAWHTQRSAVRLLGRLGCDGHRDALVALGELLRGGPNAYRATVREDSSGEVDHVRIGEMLQEQALALARIDASRANGDGTP